MKPEIHPEYKETEIVCSCGNQFNTRSTTRANPLRIEVCNKCHPFFTGKHKVVDTAGRIERYMDKYKKKSAE